MKRKSQEVLEFIEGLHEYLIADPQLRSKTTKLAEVAIQREIRPVIIDFLVEYFSRKGFKDPKQKANKSFYWEGQEGIYGRERSTTFASRNYPDFIITDPYLVAIEYKKSPNGSTFKNGIGQSIMHTMCEEFHFVYLLFQDESKDDRIKKSIQNKQEEYIIKALWEDFNVLVKIV